MSETVYTIIRALLIIISLFFITKLLGKKQLSKLSFFEYIVGITVGDIAGSISMDSALNMKEGIISIIIWTSIPLIISFFSLRSKRFRDFVEGTPTIFIKNGNLIEEHLRKEKYSLDELLEQLRTKSIFRVEDIEFATLEANGELSVLLKKSKQPLLVEDMIDTPPVEKEVYSIIMDGKLNDKAMDKCKLSKKWVESALNKRGLLLEEVFLAQVDHNGTLTFDFYDDTKSESKS
ncbi:DUF421 domain-containing protein [Niallia nealsonii]|uniref:DUF421 domain-containing protein n=1 Tax=Niallia nealsonii TaxID=115979 RepID=A0A2N0Z7T7_9BACI|nr:DUF421 domain-containing protein [Niallia nealsonii]PKG25568.1 hypothetical protein CWS01_01620 [Niallia nealsonii]